jgi:predicted aminopeptidase
MMATLSVSLAAAAAGCSDPAYAWYAVLNQLEMMTRVRPVDQVLADGSLTPEQQDKLRLVLEIRHYVANDLHLNVGNSYTTYLDTGGAPVAWDVSASPKDRLESVTWTFPLVGSIPFLHFYSREFAIARQAELVAQRYDTVLYSVAAFSTLGLFSDPILSTMLDTTEADLVDLLAHEATHATIARVNDANFSENVAVATGRAATYRYLTEKYGPDSPELLDAQQRNHDLDLYNQFLADVRAELEWYYASDAPRSEKIIGREVIFDESRQRFADEFQPKMFFPDRYNWIADFKFNNAWLLLNARYNGDLPLFNAVFEQNDFATALGILADASVAPDWRAYLRDVTGVP